MHIWTKTRLIIFKDFMKKEFFTEKIHCKEVVFV